MSNVTLEIGGRSYRVACADGQEDHIASLGRTIDAKLEGMGNAAHQNEPRTLLFAALLLADEIFELKNRPAPVPADENPEVAPQLEALADRLENLAAHLEA